MNTARVLRYARRRAGLTQRELAERSGVPQPSIARIERGASTPRVDTFDRLLRACDLMLEVESVLGRGEDPTLLLLDESVPERAAHAVRVSRTLSKLRGTAVR
jgi:transcriptional regulator with XRE-family HTH domain